VGNAACVVADMSTCNFPPKAQSIHSKPPRQAGAVLGAGLGPVLVAQEPCAGSQPILTALAVYQERYYKQTEPVLSQLETETQTNIQLQAVYLRASPPQGDSFSTAQQCPQDS